MQNAVAALPFSDQVYYALQRAVGSLKPDRYRPLEWFKIARMMINWIKDAGQESAGKRFLEIGTGRALNLPTALWLCGAEQVVTVDSNSYLSEALVAETIKFVRRRQDAVIAAFGPEARQSLFQERLRHLTSLRGGTDELLRQANIQYVAPADAARLDFPDQSFEFHVSRSVFEHIPPEKITALLAEARRLLKPQGLLLHTIDPSDHFSHDDASITAINFLQFSEGEWQLWAGNKFMYHNRLRGLEHLELFKRAGVRILRQSRAIDEPSLKVLRNGFRLDSRFEHIGPEELAVESLNLLGTFSDA